MGSLRVGHDWATSFTFHFHALEKEMATHSSVLAWRIPGTGEPDGLPSMGSHNVGHDWSGLAAAADSNWKWSHPIRWLGKIFLRRLDMIYENEPTLKECRRNHPTEWIICMVAWNWENFGVFEEKGQHWWIIEKREESGMRSEQRSKIDPINDTSFISTY